MDAPLRVGFRRELPVTLFVVAAVLALGTAGVLRADGRPAVLLVAVPMIAVLVAHGVRSTRPALVVDAHGIAGPDRRLRWSEVDAVSVDPRSGLVAVGAGVRIEAPLPFLDTPLETIVTRVEREWGRPL